MSEPVRVSDEPYAVEVESGKAYFWCACARARASHFATVHTRALISSL